VFVSELAVEALDEALPCDDALSEKVALADEESETEVCGDDDGDDEAVSVPVSEAEALVDMVSVESADTVGGPRCVYKEEAETPLLRVALPEAVSVSPDVATPVLDAYGVSVWLVDVDGLVDEVSDSFGESDDRDVVDSLAVTRVVAVNSAADAD
jgi:hypothetical protein